MAVSGLSGTPQYYIKPFDGTNYPNWEFRMKLLLEQNGVLLVLTESPPEDVEALNKFRKLDVKARNIIVQGLADNILIMIKDKGTAKAMMETLKSTYEKKGMKSLVTAQKKWRKMEFKNNKPLSEFIQEFEATCSEVRTAGGKVDDEEIVNQILVAMPQEYDSVVSAMDVMFNKDKTAVTLEYVKNTLLAEEERIKKKHDSSQTHHVFAAGNSWKGKKYWKRGNNFNRNSNKPPVDNVNSNFNGKCFSCNLRGHKRSQCPKLNNANVTSEPSGEIAFMTSMETDNLPGKQIKEEIIFVIDSGATGHLIQKTYKKYLTDIKNVSLNINVAKANESIKTICQGKLPVLTEEGIAVTIHEALVCDNLAYNLLSVRKLEENGFKVVFENGGVKIFKNSRMYLMGQLCGKLYITKMYISCENACVTKGSVKELWHRRMGHSSTFRAIVFVRFVYRGSKQNYLFCKIFRRKERPREFCKPYQRMCVVKLLPQLMII